MLIYGILSLAVVTVIYGPWFVEAFYNRINEEFRKADLSILPPKYENIKTGISTHDPSCNCEGKDD